MDVAEFVAIDPQRIDELARRARMQILRIRHLCANPTQAVRYMTARRLCAASDGAITMEALAKRGDMPGTDIYSGPLGERIASIASTGPDVATRLAEAGVRREQFNSMLLHGFVPRPENRRRIMLAFAGVLERDFADHAAWRQENPSRTGRDG